MARTLTRSRIRAGLIIGLGASLLTGILLATSALQRLEWISYDARMQLFRKDVQLHDDIAVILIDEASLAAMDPLVGRWPWPRSVYADLIEFLNMGGARAIVFDILFTQRNTAGGLDPNDARLIDASLAAGNVIYAAQVHKEIGDDLEHSYLNAPLPPLVKTRFVLPAQAVPDRGNNTYYLPIDGLYQASRGLGIVDLTPDGDGVFRRTSLYFPYQGVALPSLASAAALPLLDVPLRINGADTYVGNHPAPLDRDGRYLVNMVGQMRPYSAGGVFASIARIAAGDVENLPIFPDEFSDKVVFIGASAVGTYDLKATPLDPRAPGVYLHASVASNLLNGDFLREINPWIDFALAASMALAAAFLVLSFQSIVAQLAIPTLLVASYGAIAVLGFREGLVMGMAAPLAATGFAVLGSSAFLIFTEGREKRHVRTMFGQYVSPAVLAQLVDQYQDGARAEIGTREHLSILFSDVRGFTSLSETLQAEQVVELLNIHFSVMTEIIFRHHGTLDKFIGDAIMAFWGAPIRVPDHARRAVCAGIEMYRALDRVNAQLASRGYPAIDIGLGINTGDMVLGNIGSDRKLDYTVIGDQVNLGSRLEGLTKEYGCDLIISESCYLELDNQVPCAVVDMVRVKGKQVPIRIYWPLAHPEDPPAVIEQARTVAESSEQAFAAYVDRRFAEAERLYTALPDSRLKEIFVRRCQTFCDIPPPEKWDGVYTLLSK